MTEVKIQRPYSRAAFERSVTLRSETAQRMLEREFERVSAALYHLEVVKRIIASPEDALILESEAKTLIQTTMSAIEKEGLRLDKLRTDHGVEEAPVYTHPGEVRVQITSPLIHEYVGIIQALDQLMMRVDGLWLMGIFNNDQRANALFLWQRTILKLGRRLIGRQRMRPRSINNNVEESPEEAVTSASPKNSTMITETLDDHDGGERDDTSAPVFTQPLGRSIETDPGITGLVAEGQP